MILNTETGEVIETKQQRAETIRRVNQLLNKNQYTVYRKGKAAYVRKPLKKQRDYIWLVVAVVLAIDVFVMLWYYTGDASNLWR